MGLVKYPCHKLTLNKNDIRDDIRSTFGHRFFVVQQEKGKLGRNGRNMGVKNRGGPPKSSILIGFSLTNHPFWGTPIFGNTHIV